MVYNGCIFCSDIYAANAKSSVCDECVIILTWKSGMNYLAAVNRVYSLVKTNKLDAKLRNENKVKVML
jgi:hypothetical protein